MKLARGPMFFKFDDFQILDVAVPQLHNAIVATPGLVAATAKPKPVWTKTPLRCDIADRVDDLIEAMHLSQPCENCSLYR